MAGIGTRMRVAMVVQPANVAAAVDTDAIMKARLERSVLIGTGILFVNGRWRFAMDISIELPFTLTIESTGHVSVIAIEPFFLAEKRITAIRPGAKTKADSDPRSDFNCIGRSHQK
jgi:hypothetical protein